MRSDSGRFEGFPASGLRFLEQLAKHNERDFFKPRKELYERDLLAPMRAFVLEVSEALRRAKIGIGGDAKRSIFRVYRDVRFAADKSPYRTNVAAYLSYDGERDTPGGLYVHVGPDRKFFSVTFYNIPKPMLQRWREEMARRPARFRAVLRALARRGHTLVPPEEWDDSLARMPRGFAGQAESDLAPYFRLRSFSVRRPLTRADVTSRKMLGHAVTFAKELKPLLDFGWSLD